MVKILSFLIILVCIGCNNKPSNKNNYKLPNSKDINDIIQTIISNDSFEIKDVIEDYNARISINLSNFELPENHDEKKTPLPPYIWGSYVFDIGYTIKNENSLFNEGDSGYIAFQIKEAKILILDTVLLSNKYEFISHQKLEDIIFKKGGSLNNFPFINFSIPIFSADNNKAYVEIYFHCGHLCGASYSVFLKKKFNTKWVIVDFKREKVS